MTELLFGGIAVAVTCLLLFARTRMFPGRTIGHQRVFIMGFQHQNGNSGGDLSDEWPSVLGDGDEIPTSRGEESLVRTPIQEGSAKC